MASSVIAAILHVMPVIQPVLLAVDRQLPTVYLVAVGVSLWAILANVLALAHQQDSMLTRASIYAIHAMWIVLVVQVL